MNWKRGGGDCNALEPIEELCDGVDNDCNGFVDDALPETQECESTSDAGICSGTATCSGSQGWICDAATPVVESCDYVDNDCDELTDEDFKNEAGQYFLQEHCGTCNNSCTGAIPNATAFCSTDGVTPVCKVEACDDGFYALNEFICLPEGDSDCKPCQDDAQCDGLSCVVIGDGNYCSASCSADGDCPVGYGCEAIEGGNFCVPANGTVIAQPRLRGAKKLCEVSNDLGTCFGYEECVPAAGWSACFCHSAGYRKL